MSDLIPTKVYFTKKSVKVHYSRAKIKAIKLFDFEFAFECVFNNT